MILAQKEFLEKIVFVYLPVRENVCGLYFFFAVSIYMEQKMKEFLFAMAAAAFVFVFPLYAAEMDSRVRTVDNAVMEGVFSEPERYLPDMVESLTGNVTSVTAKVKLLHDWICDNVAYDTDSFDNPSVAFEQDYVSVLKKRRAICSGYTNLMNEMCRLAGVESVGILGYFKGFGSSCGADGGQTPNHTWNAVHADSQWQLVDVTWDAGFCDRKHFVKRYSTEWLTLTPEQFIYSHLPMEENAQYLKRPVSSEQFWAQPYVPGKFFEQGLSFADKMPAYITEIDEPAEFVLKSRNPDVMVDTDVFSTKTGTLTGNASWTDRTAGRITVRFDVPDRGTYKGRILTRRKGETVNPIFLSTYDWEVRILPAVERLVAENKITAGERDLLVTSYEKVPENDRYYLKEDLFAAGRNNAVTKILRFLSFNTQNYEEAFSFFIQAGRGYAGFGETNVRFPTPYHSYREASNIKLVSPCSGVLEKGSSITFAVQSNDFSGFAFRLKGNDWRVFRYNPGINSYELTLEVPQNMEELSLMGTNNNRDYEVLLKYVLR